MDSDTFGSGNGRHAAAAVGPIDEHGTSWVLYLCLRHLKYAVIEHSSRARNGECENAVEN